MVLRWVFILSAVVSLGVVLVSGVPNGVLLLVPLFAALAVRPTFPIRLCRAAAELFDVLPGVCLDCRDSNHSACDGVCACRPEFHQIELFIEHAQLRTYAP